LPSAPFLYGAIGFVFGAIGAWIYKLIAKRLGGIEIQLAPASAAPYGMTNQVGVI
jgi:hypothetical protein